MTFERLDRCDGPACPGCGCQDAEILVKPKDPSQKSWFGAGRVRCRHCGREFHFKELPHTPEAQPPPVDYQEAVVEHQEPVVEVPAVAYQTVRRPLCPDCGSAQVRITHTLPKLRRYQCRECAARFKRERGSTTEGTEEHGGKRGKGENGK